MLVFSWRGSCVRCKSGILLYHGGDVTVMRLLSMKLSKFSEISNLFACSLGANLELLLHIDVSLPCDVTRMIHILWLLTKLRTVDYNHNTNTTLQHIPDKIRNATRRTDQLSGRSQVMGPFRLYRGKAMSGTAALHYVCNQKSKMCTRKLAKYQVGVKL